MLFQSTSPVWRTTDEAARFAKICEFQSTSPVWRTTTVNPDSGYEGLISIHVPRVEDDAISAFLGKSWEISIHVPRVEDDIVEHWSCGGRCGFQSTSPVWRTTKNRYKAKLDEIISIHVPRVEDDGSVEVTNTTQINFNPRPPCGGRRREIAEEKARVAISIHVPRVEDDSRRSWRKSTLRQFQSTSPVWRTTDVYSQTTNKTENFNPRPPCGGRLLTTCGLTNIDAISIHVPRVEDDRITMR